MIEPSLSVIGFSKSDAVNGCGALHAGNVIVCPSWPTIRPLWTREEEHEYRADIAGYLPCCIGPKDQLGSPGVRICPTGPNPCLSASEIPRSIL